MIMMSSFWVFSWNHSCQLSWNFRDSPGFGGSIPDPEIYLDCPGFLGSSDRSGLSSVALASVEQWLWVLENKPRVHKHLYFCVLHNLRIVYSLTGCGLLSGCDWNLFVFTIVSRILFSESWQLCENSQRTMSTKFINCVVASYSAETKHTHTHTHTHTHRMNNIITLWHMSWGLMLIHCMGYGCN